MTDSPKTDRKSSFDRISSGSDSDIDMDSPGTQKHLRDSPNFKEMMDYYIRSMIKDRNSPAKMDIDSNNINNIQNSNLNSTINNNINDKATTINSNATTNITNNEPREGHFNHDIKKNKNDQTNHVATSNTPSIKPLKDIIDISNDTNDETDEFDRKFYVKQEPIEKQQHSFKPFDVDLNQHIQQLVKQQLQLQLQAQQPIEKQQPIQKQQPINQHQSTNVKLVNQLFKQLTDNGVDANKYAVMKYDAPVVGDLFDTVVSKTTLTPFLNGSPEIIIERCSKKIEAIDKTCKRLAIVRRVCYGQKTLYESTDAVQRREAEREERRMEHAQKVRDRRNADLEKKRINNEEKIKLEKIKNEARFAEQRDAKVKYDAEVRKNAELQRQLRDSEDLLRKLQPTVFGDNVPLDEQRV